jgi:hypothetical protein
VRNPTAVTRMQTINTMRAAIKPNDAVMLVGTHLQESS